MRNENLLVAAVVLGMVGINATELSINEHDKDAMQAAMADMGICMDDEEATTLFITKIKED